MSSSRNRRPRASRRREGAVPSFSPSSSEPPSARHLRVQSTLFQEVSLLFRSELSDPRLEGVSPTSFELTPDGRLIRIGYTLTPAAASGAREVQEALARASGYLRSQLAQHLDLKRVPQLRFIYIGVAERSLEAPPLVASQDATVTEDEEPTFLGDDGDEEGGER
ncbi:ribosome-binding factor A [Myxococcus sp. AM011]|uniref:ribosome-binding factor A n=1 Tax=Myxococcus sp. AM011 TaxID=2745200 RepID=UPI0015953B8D|nr:ribosome-binding factor A [Myxococcus sp. AM011]NVJ21136.1 ribosome-binding factor A [Myxococcus sp. AM011]